MSVSESVEVGGESLRLEQRSALQSFLGLSLKNGLLNVITLTLYRFWGKTEVRRRVWNDTYLNGEPLEYTGRGRELFLGFLFALALVGLPFLVMVFGAQFLGPIFASLVLLPLYLFLIFLFGFGMFTAFRYLASRTTWRGVRFHLEGSPGSYAWRYIACVFLSAITLGWFWPTARRRLAQPLWHGLRFGDRKFRFDMAASEKVPVYSLYALAWVGGAILYFVLIGVLVGSGMFMTAEGEPVTEPSLKMIGFIYLASAIFFILATFVVAPYQAAMMRSVAAGVKLENASFTLKLGARDMAWLTLSNFGLVLISLGFLMPFVQARTTKFLVARLSSEGTADLAAARQTERGPRTGEGLADAFGAAQI